MDKYEIPNIPLFRQQRHAIQIDNVLKEGYHLLQPKFDGWWCCLVVYSDGHILGYSIGGRIIFEGITQPGISMIAIGECCYGTQWANQVWDKEKYGVVSLFDLVELNGNNYIDNKAGYAQRYSNLHFILPIIDNEFLKIVPSYEVYEKDNLSTLVLTWVEQRNFEGVVFKKTDASYHEPFRRWKHTPTIDFVCTGIGKGGGRLSDVMGAICGAIYIDSVLTDVVAVGGGFSDAQRADIWDNRVFYKGKVFEARGQLYPNGFSLRHPNFVRWREDKLKEDCTIKQYKEVKV